MHLIQAVTLGDITKVNRREIPSYEILTSTMNAELKRSVIDLNEKVQSFVG